jgi:hypothetical protein
MISHFSRFLLMLCVCSSALAAPVRYKINPPPSAELNYTIKAVQKGINVTGNSSANWQSIQGKYKASAEIRAMIVGKILEEQSEGNIDVYGLAPSRFTEKRFRKEPTTTEFNRQSNEIIFSASDQRYAIKGGEQDRHSIVWQLVSIARSMPAKFKAGSTWNFTVAGRKDADLWKFKVGSQEKIKTPLGELNAIRVTKAGDTGKAQQVDIWLAPSLEWYPVKMRIAEPDGEYVEQTLESLSKK